VIRLGTCKTFIDDGTVKDETLSSFPQFRTFVHIVIHIFIRLLIHIDFLLQFILRFEQAFLPIVTLINEHNFLGYGRDSFPGQPYEGLHPQQLVFHTGPFPTIMMWKHQSCIIQEA
jgi:hypothetical protein